MGKFYATPACVSDALGNNVDFDTEYMYTPEGNKLPISYFKYDTSYALFMYVYEDLDKKDPRIKALTATQLIEIIVNDILDKLHKLNEAEEN